MMTIVMQTKHLEWLEFEHSLDYILCELKQPADEDDVFLLNDIKQAIIVFAIGKIFER